ncbi:MAG: phosphoenolpyruvate carboxykinase (ATP) [Planctomycetota bacterium]
MELELPVGALKNLAAVHHHPGRSVLVEHAVCRGEAQLANAGPLVATTGEYTGRSPKDKYVVADDTTRDVIWWDGGEAHRFAPEQLEALQRRQAAYLQGREVYVRDVYAGADTAHRLAVRVITEQAWHSLFVDNMFRPVPESERASFEPQFTIVHTPGMKAVPEVDGTRSEVYVALDFTRGMAVIGGSSYAGEIKKSVFTALNYLLPRRGVMGMHCSANTGKDGRTALFFGLSGTGKTTLSADPARALVGDDEHGWSDNGIFNFEGGCYAKVIRLSPAAEPEIYATTRRYGTILENVVMDPLTREIDLDDDSLTQNTRASYPLDAIPGVVPGGCGEHPSDIVFLTCDAFGIMPPIARLSPEQAMYHFISGYTAKVAGTERCVTEPKAAFSACFGAPFMPLHPGVYAKLLGEKIAQHGSRCWLVNTGWSGGPYGAGSRMPIAWSRALLAAALGDRLDDLATVRDPWFGFEVPTSCPGVPADVLQPRGTWTDGNAYDEKAAALVEMFRKNFQRFEAGVTQPIRNAGPVIHQPS